MYWDLQNLKTKPGEEEGGGEGQGNKTAARRDMTLIQ